MEKLFFRERYRTQDNAVNDYASRAAATGRNRISSTTLYGSLTISIIYDNYRAQAALAPGRLRVGGGGEEKEL